MSVVACGSSFSGESRGRREIYMCLAAPFRCEDVDQILLLCIYFKRGDVPGKNSSVRSQLATLACWSGGKVGKLPSKPHAVN